MAQAEVALDFYAVPLLVNHNTNIPIQNIYKTNSDMIQVNLNSIMEIAHGI